MDMRSALVGACCLLCLAVGPLGAQPRSAAVAQKAPQPALRQKAKEVPVADRLRSPLETGRPIAEKLASPRATVEMLYFGVLLYDLFPEMIEDAIACLDLDSLQPRPALEDAARLALDLEYVLQSLALPLTNVPMEATGIRVVLHDAAPIKIALEKGGDGGWRFDAETLRRVPAMARAVREGRQPRTDLVAFRDGYTDPRTTLRRFISDVARNDFYAAARALDLSALSIEQRRRDGPTLAQQLAFTLQRRGFMFRQEVPERSDGPPYTWHADRNGRISLARVRQADGKDAWQFTRQTVRNIPRMYNAVVGLEADRRYQRMNLVVPAVKPGAGAAVHKRPEDVPAHLGSPRATLEGFFRTMDGADTNDARLAESLEYLDLDNVPLADRAALGGKLALKLDSILRKLSIDLRAIPDDWNAGTQVLGEAQGVRVEIAREQDGSWTFSEATVAHIGEMYDKLAGKARTEQGRDSSLDSARDTLVTFQAGARRQSFTQAAHCLNLSAIPVSAQDELGPVLAFKLQYALDRIGRVYVQEIPDKPEGPRYVLYRGELGRIVLDRKPDEPNRGQWQFTPESVRCIESMFLALQGQPCPGGDDGVEPLAVPHFWETPGVWLRLHLPSWLQTRMGPLELYQWLGLIVAILGSWGGARLLMTCFTAFTAWLLRHFGSTLSSGFVASTLRPLTVLGAVWTLFFLLQWLDLTTAIAGPVFAAEKFFLAGLLAWVGLRLIDLSMGIYTNSERLRPHRNLGDMIVPVSMRLSKTIVVLLVATYMIYQVGQIDLLTRFLTGLGVAGLAASLAAQDAMKSYFGTLLLIGERAFKIGDRISVAGKEGIVEQVGFRSTRLRNADDALITVPNALVAAAAIDNMGLRSYRSFTTTITLRGEAPLPRLLEYRDRLRSWLGEQRLVARDRIDVQIHQANDRAVEMKVSVCLACSSPSEEAGLQETIRHHALNLAVVLGVALPASISLPEKTDAKTQAA